MKISIHENSESTGNLLYGKAPPRFNYRARTLEKLISSQNELSVTKYNPRLPFRLGNISSSSMSCDHSDGNSVISTECLSSQDSSRSTRSLKDFMSTLVISPGHLEPILTH